MKLRVLYFARLREAFGCSSEELDLPESVVDVATLLAWLRTRGGAWCIELAPGRAFRVAVDQEMATLDTPLAPHAEVAVFPPVTGG